MEAFPAVNRISETVKVYISAKFGIPKTLVSDDGPELQKVTLKSGVHYWELRKWNRPSIIQEVMD